MYDALDFFKKKMVESQDNFDTLLDRMGLRRFSTDELTYLDEYLVLMKPVANGLDKLQGNVGLGYALPTILCTKLSILEEQPNVTSTLSVC